MRSMAAKPGAPSMGAPIQATPHASVPKEATGDEMALEVTNKMKRDLNKQFNRYGVEIADVAIQSVRLPPKFERQMEERTTYETKIEEQKIKQEKDMLVLRQQEEMQTEQQRCDEKHRQERDVGDAEAASAKKELDTVIADTNKIIKDLKEKMNAEVREINATKDLKVQELESATSKALVTIEAEAKAKSQQMLAEVDAYELKKAAEADIGIATHLAEAEEVKAKAEGAAAPKLAAKREHLLRMQQIKVYESLANNERVVVTGETGGKSMLADMMVANKQATVMLNVGKDGL